MILHYIDHCTRPSDNAGVLFNIKVYIKSKIILKCINKWKEKKCNNRTKQSLLEYYISCFVWFFFSFFLISTLVFFIERLYLFYVLFRFHFYSFGIRLLNY